MGHTIKRCPVAVPDASDANASGVIGDFGGDVGFAAPAVEASGDWDKPTEQPSAW